MNKTLPALPGKAPALPPGAFEIGYTAHDGAQHRVPLAEAAVVRFADTHAAAGLHMLLGVIAAGQNAVANGDVDTLAAQACSYVLVGWGLRVVAGLERG